MMGMFSNLYPSAEWGDSQVKEDEHWGEVGVLELVRQLWTDRYII